MESYESIRIESGYLHVVQSRGFQFTSARIADVWDEIARICIKHERSKVLIEVEDFDRDLDTAGAFDSGVAASQVARGLMVALCLKGYEPDDVSDFFKTVALNRGTRIEFFGSVEEGLQWLGVGKDA